MEKLLSTREAVAYLSQRYGGTIHVGSVYRRIKKIPHETRYQGKARRYFFRKEELDTVRFRVKDRQPPVPPRTVLSDDDLEALRMQYGKLLTTEGVLRVIERRTGRRYSAAAVHKRRKNGSLTAVGVSGGKHPQYWYPAEQAETMPLQP